MCSASDLYAISSSTVRSSKLSFSSMHKHAPASISSAPVDFLTDEFVLANLKTSPSKFINPPRVARAPAALECKHWKTVEMPDVEPGGDKGHFLIIGQVIGIFIDDNFITDGIVNTAKMRPLARMGYMDYGVITPDTAFVLQRPKVKDDGTVEDAAGEWDGVYR